MPDKLGQQPKKRGGTRVVGDFFGPHTQLLWSPQDIAAKTDGRFSASKVRHDMDDGQIPPSAITPKGRIIYFQVSFLREYLNIKST